MEVFLRRHVSPNQLTRAIHTNRYILSKNHSTHRNVIQSDITNQRSKHIPTTSNILRTPSEKIIEKIIQQRRCNNNSNPGDVYQLANEYLNLEHDQRVLSPSQDALLQQKINTLIQQRFNYNPVAQAGDALKAAKQDCSTAASTNEVQEEDTALNLDNIPMRNGTVLTLDTTAIPSQNEASDIFESLGTNRVDVPMLSIWTSERSIESVYYNGYILPLVASDVEKEYISLRNSAVLFNKSYALAILVMGQHATEFLEHFVTAEVKSIEKGLLQYTPILDTKGSVMDMAYIANYGTHYMILTNGLHKRNLYDYMTAYLVSCKREGLDVTMKPMRNSSVISLQGPKSEIVLRTLEYGPNVLNLDLAITNFMNCFECQLIWKDLDLTQTESIYTMRISDVGEDGFEFIGNPGAIRALAKTLANHELVLPAGFTVYDAARMEAGIMRTDVDIPTEASPIQTSVTWSLDMKRLRYGTMFGKPHIIAQMTNGVAKVRVGVMSNEMLTTDCYILKEDTRKPIGFITSSTWSQGLQMYLSQAYVNTEHARHDMTVYISMPVKPESPLTKREFRKYYRNKTKRQFIRGTVVKLPFVLHNYKIKEEQKNYVGGRNVPLQKSDRHGVHKESQINQDMEHKNEVKTKKQLWNEVIAKQRKQNAKTLEKAIEYIEKTTTTACVSKMESKEFDMKTTTLPVDRLNIAPRDNVPLVDAIQYYKQRHEKPVPPRHRRYRPIITGTQTNV
ncbi:glycine cleavage T-protein (aminomethyl transferase) domain containing protein [Babesia bovis T2Bo]|uniref:Glycine cleavage T-protein (Aminomethyl transferase) domain containing protein n=1 Tax=Babesia bovis TaxID=5865 RepID=A7AWL7_BABBO|nr:glycine cleavage T-protein (aminomethyl transferase) domain containing protein [Babesia bovis T2Bo]EDO05445.1 glycine cleavage T-protein (aminomethyl transferase) domain containing protein [Babesia bovis T2Bo]|eukprot:XP_001609013.1 glycine cleavage T-protein (aminomethyl transferase) domain containing protein [Babesia bovis T2Bo]